MTNIKFFKDISKKDLREVGGKGVYLGEMASNGISVPSGFVITTALYKHFFNTKLPDHVKEEILTAFDKLGVKRVAVRSSARTEDSISSSWAGVLESYLNITRSELINAVRDCWNSITNERVFSYIEKQDIPKKDLLMVVVVQKMVESEVSGVMFTINPITKDSDEIMIEAGYGLGEMLVQGRIIPDNFVLDKVSLEIKEKKMGTQEKKLVFIGGHNREVDVSNRKKNMAVLTDLQIKELAEIGKKIEKYFGSPCDIEWALEKNKFYIVQSRPITV